MKRAFKTLLALGLSLMFILLCACGEEEETGTSKYGTLIYGNTDLSEYVKLGKYKGLNVDTSSKEYKAAYDAVVKKDISNGGIVSKRLKGKVKSGDTVNIDYVGKKDGVAFEGGTAKGYDLTIGSGQFIPGFEDGLIGVNIGDTVDLNLTFPKDYSKAEMAGAAVVFTVKVNYVKDNGEVKMEESYSELGFKSFKEYEENVRRRAVGNMLFETVLANSEVSDYPEKDKDTFIDAVYDYNSALYTAQYNTDFETVLSQNNMTKEDYKDQLSKSSESQMKDQMIYYSILQKEKLKPDYELADSERSGNDVLDEITKVENVVKEFLYKNAKIK